MSEQIPKKDGPVWEHRPWGHFDVLYSGPLGAVKRLVINPGGTLSLQYHDLRDEHWVAQGEGLRAVINGSTFEMLPGTMYHVQRRVLHRIINDGNKPVEVIEIITGEYNENDIVRVHDVYNREED